MSLELPQRFRRVAFGSLMVTAVLLLSGCTPDENGQIKRLALPPASSKEAPLTHDLWVWSWLAAMITGVVVWGLIFYAAFRFRRRSDSDVPVQTRYNLPIEIFYTIAPIMIVIVFFYFTVDTQNKVLHVDANPDAHVTVVGEQWSWTFNYNVEYSSSKKGYVPDGKGPVVYDAGTTAEQPTLWLVKDKSVTFYLMSPDVIHDFWVPAFLFKMDVVPGRHNEFTLTPSRLGSFQGRCAELCGVYHSRMLFRVRVVDQATYDRHIRALQAQGNTGVAIGGSEVASTPGLNNDNAGRD